MKRICLIAAIGIFASTPALAQSDPMAAFYGNTLVLRDLGTGGGGNLTLNSDNTYATSTSANGQPQQVTGTWSLQSNGTTVCLTSTSVGTVSSSATDGCVTMGGHAVGDHWDATNDSGQSLDLTLTSGS